MQLIWWTLLSICEAHDPPALDHFVETLLELSDILAYKGIVVDWRKLPILSMRLFTPKCWEFVSI